MQTASSRDLDKFVLRLPEGLREGIRDAAKAAHRSMNSEIVYQLCRLYPNAAAKEENAHG